MTAPTYEKLSPPKHGTRVTVDANGCWNIPDDPIVCLIRQINVAVFIRGQSHGEVEAHGATDAVIEARDPRRAR